MFRSDLCRTLQDKVSLREFRERVVLELLFFTWSAHLPWIKTRSPRSHPVLSGSYCILSHYKSWNAPGPQVSKIYFPFGWSRIASFEMSSSKPVPPPGKRTKRLLTGIDKCEPGRNDRAPFSGVHFSRAIQNPRAVGGSVYYRVLRGITLYLCYYCLLETFCT